MYVYWVLKQHYTKEYDERSSEHADNTELFIFSSEDKAKRFIRKSLKRLGRSLNNSEIDISHNTLYRYDDFSQTKIVYSTGKKLVR